MLDEPANGLDPQGIRWLRDFLRELAGEGRTILISSHVLAEVAQTVDEVTAFMTALTDPAARDLARVVPAAVPSGLSIDH